MQLESTTRQLSQLVTEISNGAIRLPEVQRGYVWKSTQVAAFVDSLYRGYPIGSLLFWRTDIAPRTRKADIGGLPAESGAPLYLLDGQQRLTSLHRVFNDHEAARTVFNVETEKFQNRSSITDKDMRWVPVSDILNGGIDLFELTEKLAKRLPDFDRNTIYKRLVNVEKIKERTVHLEILTEFDYQEVSDIFIRVNSGRSLTRSDLALATLSARRPGTLEQLETEAAYWAERGWDNLDLMFLARALTGAVLGRGLTPASNNQLLSKTDEELDAGWATVQRGLRHLVPLLKENLGISHGSLLNSVVVLLPLVVLLGERPDEPLEPENADAILYWFLAATLRNRYSGSTDTKLGQDIPDARRPDGINRLLDRLGLPGGRLEVLPRDLAGRAIGSAHFMMSFLVAKRRGARDWWSGAAVSVAAEGGHKLEYHHVFPQVLLRRTGEYGKTEINDIANLVFIAGRANRGIGAKRPAEYLVDLGLPADDLAAHSIPNDPTLWEEDAYRDFLARRRELLAESMNEILDRLRPAWLQESADPAEIVDEPFVDFTCIVPDGGDDQLHIEVRFSGGQWEGVCDLPELFDVLQEASLGFNSELVVSGTSVAVSAGEDQIAIAMGPVRLIGSKDEWAKTLGRIVSELEYREEPLAVDSAVWEAPVLDFAVTAVV